MSHEGYEQCLSCRQEFEAIELFTLYQSGFFIALCKPCLNEITKEKLRQLLESDETFLKRKLQSSRYLQCPVCHSSKVENDFIVMIVEDASSPMGVDGFAVCRSCFKDKFEKPDMTEQTLVKIANKMEVKTAELSTTSHMNNLVEYNKLMDELVPKLPTDRFECSVCSQVFLPKDMPYIIAHTLVEGKNGNIIIKHTSGKVCLECYRSLWNATVSRGMRESVYDILQQALVKLTLT